MRTLSLFSGIGAFEKSIVNLGLECELVGYSEIDKYASKSYSAVHGIPETMNLGDITKIDEQSLPKDIDLACYGFPCTDISLAGKQKGFYEEDGSLTRSGLFFEALRIIEATQPRVAIAENVKNLVGKKFKEQFEIVLESLENAGYNNYWKVLNAKDYGIPQNRERVFIVSIRKDIDNGMFTFPEGFPLELRLKDMLEDVVDEKYYLTNKATEKMTLNLEKQGQNFIDIVGHSGTGGERGFIHTTEGGIGSLSATDYKQPKQIIEPTDKPIQAVDLNHYKNDQMNRVYSPDGISPTILVKSGGGRETKVLVGEGSSDE